MSIRLHLVCILTLLTCIAAPAAAQPRPEQRPVRLTGSSFEEPRYTGVDVANWLQVQALGTATEAIRRNGTGTPVCVPWESTVSTRATQDTCWCWSMDPNVTLSAPTADGGCSVTDSAGPDGLGSCWSTAANETSWSFPAWQVVSRRAGARGFVGTTGGVCTVATSTTVGQGSELRVPCTTTADCTAIVGSGTCRALQSPLPTAQGEALTATSRTLQLGRSCAYLVARPAAAATAFVGGKR